MKNSTYMIGKIIIAVSIVAAAVILGLILSDAIQDASAYIGRNLEFLAKHVS